MQLRAVMVHQHQVDFRVYPVKSGINPVKPLHHILISPGAGRFERQPISAHVAKLGDEFIDESLDLFRRQTHGRDQGTNQTFGVEKRHYVYTR